MSNHFYITKHSFLSLSTFFVALVTLFSSCGEDRTHEYQEKTEHNFWIFEQMSANYLWADKFVEMQWKDYFATPDEYFKKLTNMGEKDSWSYIVVDSLKTDCFQRGNFHHTNSYGFDFVLMNDPTNETTKTYARVVTVFDGSPADRASLQRNDFIEMFDGYKLSQKNQVKLVNGTPHSLIVKRLDANSDSAVYYWAKTRTVEIDKSQYVEDKAIAFYRTIPLGDLRVGYALINRLTESAPEKPDLKVDYKADLDAMMNSFRSNKVDDLILDFRLCNFGSFDMARRLASYVIPDNCMNKIFAKTKWSTANASKNDSVTFDTSLAGKTLNMKKVYIITSKYTRGAAEWVIMSLRYALGAENVILVGTGTAGQNVMTQHIGDHNNMIHLYPAVASIYDGNDETFQSFTPEEDNVIDEFLRPNLYEYGQRQECLLDACMALIIKQ